MMTAADKFTWTSYDTLLRLDFVSFAQRCLCELSPRAQFAMNWHIEIIAAKLMAVRAGKIRRLIISLPLSPERQAVPEFETTAQGCRLATSVGGVLTGRGADLIIIDDPLKPEEALSQAQRRAANEWFDHTLYSRLNDKLAGAIVLIMHRLHEDDLVGHVLAQEDWEVVNFPAIAEVDEAQLIDTVWGPKFLTRRQGGHCIRRVSRSRCSSTSAR